MDRSDQLRTLLRSSECRLQNLRNGKQLVDVLVSQAKGTLTARPMSHRPRRTRNTDASPFERTGSSKKMDPKKHLEPKEEFKQQLRDEVAQRLWDEQPVAKPAPIRRKPSLMMAMRNKDGSIPLEGAKLSFFTAELQLDATRAMHVGMFSRRASTLQKDKEPTPTEEALEMLQSKEAFLIDVFKRKYQAISEAMSGTKPANRLTKSVTDSNLLASSMARMSSTSAFGANRSGHDTVVKTRQDELLLLKRQFESLDSTVKEAVRVDLNSNIIAEDVDSDINEANTEDNGLDVEEQDWGLDQLPVCEPPHELLVTDFDEVNNNLIYHDASEPILEPPSAGPFSNEFSPQTSPRNVPSMVDDETAMKQSLDVLCMYNPRVFKQNDLYSPKQSRGNLNDSLTGSTHFAVDPSRVVLSEDDILRDLRHWRTVAKDVLKESDGMRTNMSSLFSSYAKARNGSFTSGSNKLSRSASASVISSKPGLRRANGRNGSVTTIAPATTREAWITSTSSVNRFSAKQDVSASGLRRTRRSPLPMNSANSANFRPITR